MQIDIDTDEACVGYENGLIVLVWRSGPSFTTVKAAIDVILRRLGNAKEKCMLLVVVKPEVGPMSGDVRKHVEKSLFDSREGIGGVAIAVIAKGFGAAAMRAAMTGFYLVARPPYEVKVHADVPGAASWIEGNWAATAPRMPAATVARLVSPLLGE